MFRLLNRLVFCFLFIAVTMPLTARAGDIIVLKPSPEVNSASIRLSDVFSGVPASIDRHIATAPLAGKSVTYDVRVLTALADKYKLDWRPDSLADRSVITRAATRITQDMIQAVVLNKLKEQNIKGTIDVQFDNNKLEINLPADREPQFALNNFTYDTMSKRFRSHLVAETGGTPITLPVTGRLIIKREIPVLSRRLESGTTIAKTDIAWMMVADDRLTRDIVTEPSQLIGRETRHDIAEGQPLYSRDIMPPRLVTRGSLVTLKVQTPHMLITAQGRALQDGTSGDVVRVTNTQSNRVVEGIVDGAGVVRIQTAQKLTLAQQ